MPIYGYTTNIGKILKVIVIRVIDSDVYWDAKSIVQN